MRQVAAAGLPRFAELGEIQPGLRFAGSALKELGAVLREPRGAAQRRQYLLPEGGQGPVRASA
jgi:hypothetical protein